MGESGYYFCMRGSGEEGAAGRGPSGGGNARKRGGRGRGAALGGGIPPSGAEEFSDWPEGESISDHVFCRILFSL